MNPKTYLIGTKQEIKDHLEDIIDENSFFNKSQTQAAKFTIYEILQGAAAVGIMLTAEKAGMPELGQLVGYVALVDVSQRMGTTVAGLIQTSYKAGKATYYNAKAALKKEVKDEDKEFPNYKELIKNSYSSPSLVGWLRQYMQYRDKQESGEQ